MSQVYLHTSFLFMYTRNFHIYIYFPKHGELWPSPYKRPPGNLWIPTLAPQIVATSRKGFHAIHGVGSKPQLSWHYLGPVFFRWKQPESYGKMVGWVLENPGPMWSWVNFWIKGEWFWQDWGIFSPWVLSIQRRNGFYEICKSRGMVLTKFDPLVCFVHVFVDPKVYKQNCEKARCLPTLWLLPFRALHSLSQLKDSRRWTFAE